MCDLSQKVTMNCFKFYLFLVLIQFRLFSPSLRVILENFIARSNAQLGIRWMTNLSLLLCMSNHLVSLNSCQFLSLQSKNMFQITVGRLIKNEEVTQKEEMKTKICLPKKKKTKILLYINKLVSRFVLGLMTYVTYYLLTIKPLQACEFLRRFILFFDILIVGVLNVFVENIRK